MQVRKIVSVILVIALLVSMTSFATLAQDDVSYGKYELYKNGTFLIGVAEQTDINTFLENLGIQDAAVIGKNDTPKHDTDIVVTGDVLAVSGAENKIIIVAGDTDGNGIINTTDYLQIKSHFLRQFVISGEFFTAADIDINGEINTADYLMIKKHFLKVFVVKQTLSGVSATTASASDISDTSSTETVNTDASSSELDVKTTVTLAPTEPTTQNMPTLQTTNTTQSQPTVTTKPTAPTTNTTQSQPTVTTKPTAPTTNTTQSQPTVTTKPTAPTTNTTHSQPTTNTTQSQPTMPTTNTTESQPTTPTTNTTESQPTTPTTEPTVTVPDLMGDDFTDAHTQLYALGVQINATVQTGGSSNTTTVSSQSPAAGTVIHPGDVVNVVLVRRRAISSTSTVPNLIGKTQSEAESAVSSLNQVTISAETVYTTAYATGTIFFQSLASGSYVARGMTIYVKVCGGTPPVSVFVPNVVGQTSDNAKRMIEASNLTYSFTNSYSDTVPAGSIISQGTPSGSSVYEGTVITVVVSLGAKTSAYTPVNFETMKIMKLTQWDMDTILTSGGSQTSEATFTSKMDTIMANIQGSGFNTVFFQVRPFADSFYKSAYYPLSYFVTGSYSKQTIAYDPVAIVIEKAHKYGLSLHAWINPMRCMTESELQKLPSGTQLLTWYNNISNSSSPYYQYMFKAMDAGGTSRIYLNVANQEVRNLIVNGVKEITDLYNVDGIFMDDYFYPEAVIDNTTIDSYAFTNRTDKTVTSRFKFRCNAVNEVVKGIYAAVKESDSRIIYGVSPNGQADYAYSSECADMYTWCSQEGYIDIIYPQFYYGMMHGSCAVDKLTQTWAGIITNKNIKFVPILTLHKAGLSDQWAVTSDGMAEWQNYNDVLLASLTYLAMQDHIKVSGSGFFCYQYFYNGNESSSAVVAEINNFTFLWKGFEKVVNASTDVISKFFTDNGKSLSDLVAKWNARILASSRKVQPFSMS